MFSKIVFTFVLLFTVLESVFGATCTNSTTCVVSTHTPGACDSNTKVCTCDSSYTAIRTGCGTKLSTPILSQPSGYSTLVLEGKNATLTCSSPDGATLFEWTFKGSVINGTTASTYTISAASTSDAGIYKCKAKFSGNSNLDSDLSNDLTISIFQKIDSTLAKGPTIYLSTTTVFTGKSVTVNCIDIPMGYNTAKVVMTDSASNPITSPLKIDSGNEKTSVKCELTDTATSHTNKITGSTTNLPTIVTDISAPTTISTTALDNGVYTKDAPITLNCVTTPDVAYVDTTAKPITWAWLKDNTVIPGASTQTYVLPQEEGSYTIKCRASTATQSPLDSAAKTFVRNSTYVTVPIIKADPTTPVLGSRLTLACGSVVDGAMYSWKKDSTDIARQFEQTIQLDNLTTSDNGAYVCTVKRSMVTQTSVSFTVNVSAGQEIVKVSMLVLGLTLLMSKVFA